MVRIQGSIKSFRCTHYKLHFDWVKLIWTKEAYVKTKLSYIRVDLRKDAPYILIHFKPFQLSVATAHRTFPRPSLTIHLEIRL